MNRNGLRIRQRLALCCVALLPLACGGDEGTSDPVEKKNSAEVEALVLESSPGEGMMVMVAREEDSGAKVTVQGRVQEVVRGYASFRLVDDSIAYCGQEKPEECPTPWDYCCTPPAQLKAALMFVEARDASGNPLRAVKLPGIRPCDLVTITGTIERDEKGNATLVATGWYRNERPEFKHEVRWP